MFAVCGVAVAALGRGTLLFRSPAVPARHHPLHCAGTAAWPDEWDGQGTYAPPPVRPTGRWQRIGACDVLLPEFGGECGAIIHFVGGALVGGAPQQTYGAFLETLADHGLCIVANPSGGLTGLDHYEAAREVGSQWTDMQPELRKELSARGVAAPARLPVVGLGHSLGCKLLLLLGSQPAAVSQPAGEAAAGLGHRANILVSFNNFDARRSVPLLEPAAKLQAALHAWPQPHAPRPNHQPQPNHQPRPQPKPNHQPPAQSQALSLARRRCSLTTPGPSCSPRSSHWAAGWAARWAAGWARSGWVPT